MPGHIEAIGIFLVLLPGFSCAFLVQHIVVRPKQTELDKVVEALLLSFILYLVTSPFFHYSLPLRWTATTQQHFTTYEFQLSWPYIFWLFLGAVLLALLYGANVNHDWLLKLLRKCKITEKTARSSIWNDAFQDIKNTYVLVGLEDGRSVIGYLRYYSDEQEDASLLLEDAAWLDRDGEQQPIQGPGILLTKAAGIQSVSFLDAVATDSPEQLPEGS
ncbi:MULTISPECIES: DUF6338 family protein [Acidobacterium]|uniref:Uncharacterized protein n=1 Tax=Acidobacterium capsulatum (strain ATCC 51196 / DSM 11244 / BCRC 80197 / JCM 7670 / NBRC 15755 / NCIMB 13165 / 161) TaxID=240015 RepID=C1F3R1_ACIC5|nr:MULTISPECIES: DUF6338 family protein [Acidobacterium]ACO33364.1 conserved hypothetical protein [Acidobacterium capsulatum ATCC 51196]HCT60562.1 hypothetical protein [Acidobacterium sp.]